MSIIKKLYSWYCQEESVFLPTWSHVTFERKNDQKDNSESLSLQLSLYLYTSSKVEEWSI